LAVSIMADPMAKRVPRAHADEVCIHLAFIFPANPSLRIS